MDELTKNVLYYHDITIEEIKNAKKEELKRTLIQKYKNLYNIINDKSFADRVSFRLPGFSNPLNSVNSSYFEEDLDALINRENIFTLIDIYNEFEQRTFKNYLKEVERAKKIKTE